MEKRNGSAKFKAARTPCVDRCRGIVQIGRMKEISADGMQVTGQNDLLETE